MEIGTSAWWEKLAQDINRISGYHLLQIGFRANVDFSDHSWYERSAIQRVVLHEGLFSIYLAWTAVFYKKLKHWIWRNPPNSNADPVGIIDSNTINEKGINVLSYKETSYGQIIQLVDDLIVYPRYYYKIDPLDKNPIDYKKSDWTCGGSFILPPNYTKKLHINEIKFINEF